jgi:hypothetical protein
VKVTTVVHVPFLRPEAADFDFFAYEEFNLEMTSAGALIVRPKKNAGFVLQDLPGGSVAARHDGGHARRRFKNHAGLIRLPKGAVPVVKPQGTGETGSDRPAAPIRQYPPR